MQNLLYLLIIFISLFAIYYFRTAVKKPSLTYQATQLNETLKNNMPTLNEPYYPTPWCFNTHLQLIVLGLIKGFAKPLEYDRADIITTEDGGQISVDWLGLDLPDETPTMLVLHTISGSPHSMRGFVDYVYQKLGWRVALCVRRGHGDMALKTPNYNTMGNTKDFERQINHVRDIYPNSNLYATGLSAGSGVLAQYLGQVGRNTPIKAAIAYCPAYDMRNAFSRAIPFYSKMMAKKLRKLFITPNIDLLDKFDSFSALNNSDNLHEFHQHLYEVAGNESTEDYMKNSNPSVVFDNIQIPILILNSKDDPVCHIDNVYENQHRIEAMSNAILVMTERGSHCAYFEGLTAKPWANRLIKEYFHTHENITAT